MTRPDKRHSSHSKGSLSSWLMSHDLLISGALAAALAIGISGCQGSGSTSVTTTAAPGQTIGCPAGLNLLSASCCNASGVQTTFNTTCPPPFTPDNPPTVQAAQMAAAAAQGLTNANAAVGKALAMKPPLAGAAGSQGGLPSISSLASVTPPTSKATAVQAAQLTGAGMSSPAAALSPSSVLAGGGMGAGSAGYMGGGDPGGGYFGGMGALGAAAPPPAVITGPGAVSQNRQPAAEQQRSTGVGMMSAGGVGNAGMDHGGGPDFSSLLGGHPSQALVPSPAGAGVKGARFAGEANRTLASVDPTDYFSRSSSFDNLFKLVEHRYQKTQLGWTLSETRSLGRSAPAAAAPRKPLTARLASP